jgi:predicted hydrocarbon binding protein
MLNVKPVPLKTLTKDPKTGLIIESISGEHIVTFRTKTFLQLADKLMELLGVIAGGTVLHQMGIDIGRSAYDYLKKEVKSDCDLVDVIDVVMAERGWGRCRALERVAMRGVTYRVKIEGNPISGKHGKNEPMCHFMEGMCAGFLEAYLHKKAKSTEQVSCAATGAPCCVFEITFE